MSYRQKQRLSVAIRRGLSVVEAAAIAGVNRSSAYAAARAAGLVQAKRVAERHRRRILTLLNRGYSLRRVAAAIAISKTSVLRVRDRASDTEQQGQVRFRRSRQAANCPTCGRLVRIVPCVACVARGQACQLAGS